jgi:hypothetical protein
MPMRREALSLDEVASLIQLSRTVERAIARGDLPAFSTRRRSRCARCPASARRLC